MRQNFYYLQSISHSAARGYLVTQDRLFSIVMRPGAINEQTTKRRLLHRPSGETLRNLNDVLLSISPIDAESVQLHQFASVVLIDPISGPIRTRRIRGRRFRLSLSLICLSLNGQRFGSICLCIGAYVFAFWSCDLLRISFFSANTGCVRGDSLISLILNLILNYLRLSIGLWRLIRVYRRLFGGSRQRIVNSTKLRKWLPRRVFVPADALCGVHVIHHCRAFWR